MGRSFKWRVNTPGGERLVRVQPAQHGTRIRLFVNEKLLKQYDAEEDLRDCGHVHDFDVEGVVCRLEISGGGVTLKANGADLEPAGDNEHNPDPQRNAARIVKQATASDSRTPADVEAAWLAWSAHIQGVDERGMTLLRAAFEAGYEAKSSSSSKLAR